jgi:ClpP class serine protease
MQWLLSTEVLNRMREARRLGYEPTLDERREFAAAMKEAYARDPMAAGPRNLKVAGDVAQINVKGVLTEEPDCFALLFGGGNTTYAMIREALATADADPAVKSIVLSVDSPGGSVHGLFETLAAIEATKKPIRSVASMAASAAYAIVATAGPIQPVTFASPFGSIGVAASIDLDDAVLDIASTEAPNKRPDLTTEEGRAVVRGELDALHELFVDRIAAGRTFTTGEDFDAKRVNTDFGRGGVLLAKEAKKRGMIDGLPKSVARSPRAMAPTNPSAELGGSEPEETIPMTTMTKDQLKAQHPELYNAMLEEGATAATTAERKRACDHIKLGIASGDIAVAHKAIESGASVADMQADYLAANMRKQAQGARQAETSEAEEVVANTPPATKGLDNSDLVVAAMNLPAPKKPA